MNILIAGDLVPTPSNYALFENADVEGLLGNQLNIHWNSSDFRITNLETPLIENSSPIVKTGRKLGAPSETLPGLNALQLSVVGLANNHIMDHGEPGLQHTLTLLESIKVPHVGAGKDLKESCSFTVLEKDDIRVGVFGVAEHEFSIATETCAGANPFNPLRTGDFIKQQKQELRLNAIIILFHGGKEYYRYPSPGLQANCRHLVEKGADLVVCQHSHCVGAYEHYLDGDIIYGQGNFIFDTKHVISSESVLISYEIQKEQPGKITYIPIMRNISNHGSVTLAEGAEGESICAAMKARSIEITHPGFLEEAYRNFSQKQISAYLRIASPFGMWFERVDKRLFNGRLIRALYKQNKTMRLMNVIRCESHRELFLEGLDVLHRNRKDS